MSVRMYSLQCIKSKRAFAYSYMRIGAKCMRNDKQFKYFQKSYLIKAHV